MKRAPIVLTGTVAGVVGILSYHTAAPSTSALAGTTAAAQSTASTASTQTGAAATTTTTAAAAATTTTSKTTATTRTVTGEDVSYRYGDLEVKVTATGSKITSISIVRADVTDPHSESIDQYAIPQLEQQALAAQSAKINGVSGASYTSAAYAQSLQSALDKLA